MDLDLLAKEIGERVEGELLTALSPSIELIDALAAKAADDMPYLQSAMRMGGDASFMNWGIDISTFELLRLHLSKYALVYVFLFYNRLMLIWGYWLQVLTRWRLAHYIAWNSANLTKRTTGFRFISAIKFAWDYVTALIGTFQKYIRLATVGYTPTERDITSTFPALTPESIGLILHKRRPRLPPPPEIPKPYLDADKIMEYPTEQEVQSSFALRKEYHFVHKTHHALEKANLRKEMARIVVLSSFIPNIKHINIFESSGTVWQEESDLESIKTSIFREFKTQSLELSESFPKITIIDLSRGSSLILNEDNHTKEIIVYLSDSRNRKELLGTFLKENLQAFDKLRERNENQIFDKFAKLYPPSSELIISTSTIQPNNIRGFASFNTGEIPIESVVFFNDSKLDYYDFVFALYYYSKNKPPVPTEGDPLTESPITPENYKKRLVQRLRQLRLFDHNSNVSTLP